MSLTKETSDSPPASDPGSGHEAPSPGADEGRGSGAVALAQVAAAMAAFLVLHWLILIFRFMDNGWGSPSWYVQASVTVLAGAIGCLLVLIGVRRLAKRRSWAGTTAAGLALIAVGMLASLVWLISVWAPSREPGTVWVGEIVVDAGPKTLVALLALVALGWVLAVRRRFPHRVLDRALWHYADFRGRSRRAEWAWFNYALSGGLLFVAASPLYYPATIYPYEFGRGDFILEVITAFAGYGLVTLALLIPSLAVIVRRLHDTDRSGWLVLLNLIPVAGLVVFVFCLLPGTRGENRFGPDPRVTAD